MFRQPSKCSEISIVEDGRVVPGISGDENISTDLKCHPRRPESLVRVERTGMAGGRY